jgi:hypothetical protein
MSKSNFMEELFKPSTSGQDQGEAAWKDVPKEFENERYVPDDVGQTIS